ncbi:MAG: hypothetical protein ACFBQW_02580 [Sphingomonadaceae bacterium]
MRDLFSKIMTGSMVAGAALVLAACNGEDAEPVEDEAMVTDVEEMEPVDGTTNDVTAVDATEGADMNMTMDSNMSDVEDDAQALENAAKSVENAAESIDNAQDAM